MKTSLIAFTDQGEALADRLAGILGGEAVRCGRDFSLDAWTAARFSDADALIFVGAAGIAVRAVAPYIKNKAEDPAVVVVDECGRYAVPILSGHLGGANALARRIASICGAEAVITTATDRNGVFPVDEWARVQGCVIPEPERIKRISSRLLAGESVTLRSDWPIEGSPPPHVELVSDGSCLVRLSLCREDGGVLNIVPRVLVLGIGCRRGISMEKIEAAFSAFMEKHRLWEQAVCRVCSVDLKAEEAGILAFCERRSLPFETFSAEALAAVPGTFSSSEYVRSVTGVDNICERSAVLGSGGGSLLCAREASEGITLALAARPFRPDWRITDG